MATATLANTRLSFVDGTAFADFSASGSLTPFLGQRLTVYDSAGKKAIGYIKAAGTGETLGSELVTSWTNQSSPNNWDTHTLDGINFDSLIKSSGDGTDSKSISNNTGLLAGALKYTTANITNNGGTPGVGNIFVHNALSNGGYSIVADRTAEFSTKNLTIYYVQTSDASSYLAWRSTTLIDISVSGISQKQVLTPSATGVTITSTPGGSTYNWESIESGFNYNDASGYSFYVTSSSSGIYKRRMRVFKKR